MAQWYHTCSLARGIQDRIPGTPSVIIKQNTSVALGLVSSIQADVKVSGKCSIVGHTRSVVWRMLLADKNGQNTDLPCSNLLFSVIFGFLVKFYIRISTLLPDWMKISHSTFSHTPTSVMRTLNFLVSDQRVLLSDQRFLLIRIPDHVLCHILTIGSLILTFGWHSHGSERMTEVGVLSSQKIFFKIFKSADS